MDYEEVVAWFFCGLKNGVQTLDCMQKGCSLFNNVERSLRCVHVGGTNGKGSTCFKIARIFQNAGYKVGLYTSPHICSMCERIQIDGVPISEEDLARILTLVLKKERDLSPFEAMTLAAFIWFAENKVDFSVLEVGLGGRLDATNVCHPDLSVITSISLDHTEYLGTTLQSITENKAGIIKKNTPVVIGPRVPYEVVARQAKTLSAPLYRVEGTFVDYDEENNAVAREALRVLSEKWPGLDSSLVSLYRPPCRFEKINKKLLEKNFGEFFPEIILDVAHNPDGIEKLLEKFGKGKAVFLCSISRDKDVQSMVASLIKKSEGLICTQAAGTRAMDAQTLGKIALDMKPTFPVRIETNVAEALLCAVKLAIEKKVPLIVTGTFYLMDQVKKILGE